MAMLFSLRNFEFLDELVLIAIAEEGEVNVNYSREDACRAWLTYGMFRADLLCDLLEEYGTAETVYDQFCTSGGGFLKKYVNDYGIEQLTEHAPREIMHDMLLTMQRLGIGVMGLDDPQYPDRLRHIQAPPAVLFYRGDPACLMGKCLSVVGSRKASPQGIDATRRICAELSAAGVTIISGLAMGIDAAAHEGCLQGGSPTAAVMGCGLDVDYPAENASLREQIVADGGVLLSEYPPGIRANKHVFQVRNRIISGLSRALLLMESQIKSGSFLTVHHALDQGREVYAYPGIPGTEWAEGAHQLLREGANYFTSAQDILDDLGWADDLPVPTRQEKAVLPDMDNDQRKVYSLLSQGEKSFDQLAAETGLATPALSVALTMLQMMGLVKSMPGKTYCRN